MSTEQRTSLPEFNVHDEVEQRMVDLLERSSLPTPDAVEHGDHQVRFLWTEPKVAVVIDMNESEGL